jgi:hypothetical protein
MERATAAVGTPVRRLSGPVLLLGGARDSDPPRRGQPHDTGFPQVHRHLVGHNGVLRAIPHQPLLVGMLAGRLGLCTALTVVAAGGLLVAVASCLSLTRILRSR